MSWPRRWCLILAACVFIAKPWDARASNDDHVNAEPITADDKAFFLSLKKAIETDQENWVAAQVWYPIKVTIGHKRRRIHNAKEFVAHYKEIINEHVRTVVLKQAPDDLFVNSEGLMVGDGEIWIIPTLPDPKVPTRIKYWIFTINNAWHPPT